MTMPDSIVTLYEHWLALRNIESCLTAGTITEEQAERALDELEDREAQS